MKSAICDIAAVCCYKLLLLTSFLLVFIRIISPSDSFSQSNTQCFTSWLSVGWQNRCFLSSTSPPKFSRKIKHSHSSPCAFHTDFSLLTLLLVLLLLSGDVEPNPGPPNDTVKCVCLSSDESGLML